MHDGYWFWASNGQPLKFKKFADRQPDNFQNNEFCLELDVNQLWNDLNCNHQLFVICE